MISLIYNHLIKCNSGLNFFTKKHAGTKEFWIGACTVWVWMCICCVRPMIANRLTFEATPPVSHDGRYYIHGHRSLKNQISLSNYTFLESVIAGLHFDMHFFIFRPTLGKNYVEKTIFYHDKRNHFSGIIKKNIWE